MLGDDLGPARFLEKPLQEEIKKIPPLEHNPPLPFELENLDEIQRLFWIRMHPHLPSPYFLTKSPLNMLIQFNDDQFHKICRFLGIFDLFEELKKNIETRLNKAVKESLSHEELVFLHSLKDQDNPVKLPKMHLGAWDKTKSSLDQALYERGRMRLRGAISYCYESFFEFIPKEFSPLEKKPSKEIAELLLKQIQLVLNKAFKHVKHI